MILFEKIEQSAGGVSVGRREGRLSEKLPAAPVRAAKAELFIPFKATYSRKSLPRCSAFKRGKLAQTLIDIFALGFLGAFASLLGLAIVVAPLVLLFGWR